MSSQTTNCVDVLQDQQKDKNVLINLGKKKF
jgi:hypothetical protein